VSFLLTANGGSAEGGFSFRVEGGGPIRVIHRLRQPARSKEQGNSFAGGQGADLHSPCTPGRERTATSTPSRLTFAVNKICVNLRNLWLFLCLRVFVANFVFCPLLISSQSQEVQKKCSKTVNFLQFLLKTRSFLQKKTQKSAKKCSFLPSFFA
jgi:hypothetical protein